MSRNILYPRAAKTACGSKYLTFYRFGHCLLDTTKQRGHEKGCKKEGRAEEIIASGYEFGLSDENILDRLQKRMQISMQVAWQYLLRYGKHSESIGEKASV